MRILDFRFLFSDLLIRSCRGTACRARSVAVAIILLAIALSNCFADARADIDSLANQARYAADTFMQKSVELRLGYEYRQGFASAAQAQTLHELAQKTAVELEDIIQDEEKIKKQIENYSGEDWDRRYGDSGVWRMVGADICNTKLLKCQMEYYWAIASQQHEQARILKSDLDQLAALPETVNVILAKADIYAALGKTDPSSKELAGELYRKILMADKVPAEVYFPAAVAAQKLDPPLSPQVLDELAVRIARSDCRDNFELNMTLAFLQRRVGSTAILEKAVKRWPQTKNFVGNLILSDLVEKRGHSTFSPVEVDCVITAALQNGPEKYADVLDAMSKSRDLQMAGVLYATAVSNIQKSPARAIDLFIKASVAHREPNDGYESSATMAKQGAILAINLFKTDPSRCELVKHAVQNYFTLAGSAVDEQVEYSYCKILSDCNDGAVAEKLLQKIAAKNNSKFSRRAKDDLSTLAVNKSQLLLDRGQLFEAADVLIAADVNVCNCRAHVINLLSRYIDRIDEYVDANMPDHSLIVLAERLFNCSDWQHKVQGGILYAQIIATSGHGKKSKLDEMDGLLAQVSWTTLDLLAAQCGARFNPGPIYKRCNEVERDCRDVEK